VHRPSASVAAGAPHAGHVGAAWVVSPPAVTDRWNSHSSFQCIISGGICPDGSGGRSTLTANEISALS